MMPNARSPARRKPDARTGIQPRGDSQRELLGALLHTPGGLTAAELVRALGITENAVREHLAALESDGLVAFKVMPAQRGRPKHVYHLTGEGREAFPRRYSELAQSLMGELGGMLSEPELKALLRRSGKRAAQSLSAIPVSVVATARAMKQLGYEATARKRDDGTEEIVAMNCVFHHLAQRFPAVCEFDLAFMKSATGRAVQHRECMVRGGQCCRFSFAAAD